MTTERARRRAPSRGATVAADPRIEMLRQMLRIRRFEERCVELYSSSAIRGFMHLCIGEEAVSVGVLSEISVMDAVVTTYREHGHALARGLPMAGVLAEMFGRATGVSRGRGGSMHLFDRERRFYGGNGIVAGGLPIAVGLALAEKMRHADGIVVCLFGDGAMAEGEFHESANLAALWHLPVVFCCENNGYAMGTALDREHAQTDLAARAASYGMDARAVDGMDVVAVRDAARRAVEGTRTSGEPCFLELRTYRFRAHSMYDPDRYRNKAEIAAWRERDPIPALRGALLSAGAVTQADVDAMETAIAAEIDAAVREAEAAPEEPVADLTRFVCSEVSGDHD